MPISRKSDAKLCKKFETSKYFALKIVSSAIFARLVLSRLRLVKVRVIRMGLMGRMGRMGRMGHRRVLRSPVRRRRLVLRRVLHWWMSRALAAAMMTPLLVRRTRCPCRR